MLSEIRQAVLNPWDVVPAAQPEQRPGTALTFGTEAPMAFIEIAAPGIYRLKYEDLRPLGLTDVAPQYLRLFRGADQVAFAWEGNDSDLFEPDEALLFFGEPRFSRWSNSDTYRLMADTVPGTRMPARSADPTGLPNGIAWVEQLAEENHTYTPDFFCGHMSPGRDGDQQA